MGKRSAVKAGVSQGTKVKSAKPRGNPARRPRTPRPKDDSPRLTVFLSYSHKDSAYLERLKTQLSPLAREGVELWYDNNIDPGAEIDPGIRKALKRARVFVAIVSPDYLESRYCYDREYRYAEGRRKRGTMCVVAAIVRACGWQSTAVARYKALPRDGKPANEWPSRDRAYKDIADGIRRVVQVAEAEAKVPRPKVRKRRNPKTPKAPLSPSSLRVAPRRSATRTPRVGPRAVTHRG